MRVHPAIALRIQREVDHHDRVLLHDADEQDHADQRDQAKFRLEQQKREHRADTGRRQRGENSDRVDVTLIKNTQHDIDRDNSGENEKRLARKRRLENLRRAGERAMHRNRNMQIGHGTVDRIRRNAEGFAFRQVEREGRGDEWSLVIDRKRRRARPERTERRQRHHRLLRRADRRSGRCAAACAVRERIELLIAHGVGRDLCRGIGRRRCHDRRSGHRARCLRAAGGRRGGTHINVFQRFRALPELRRDFHRDMILIERVVDRRNLALPERVIQRVVDLGERNTQPRRRLPVHRELDLKAFVLLIGIHVLQFGNILQRFGYLRHPLVQLVQRVGLNAVLILRIALASAGANILRHTQKQACAGDAGKLRP